MESQNGAPPQIGGDDTRLALLASIVEYSNDSITSISLDGIMTSWNPAAERMYGYSAEEMIGQPFSTLIDSGDTDEVADILGKIRNGQRVEHYETVRVRKDGSAFPVSLTRSPICDSTGAIVGASSIARDMTEQKKASENASKMASIVEFSDDAILSESLDGIITSWNPAAERMYGYSAEEMIGQNALLLFPPELQQQINELRMKIYDGHRIEHFETVRVRKDGSEFPVSLTISPIRDFTGAIVGASSIGRDMTEQKQASENARMMAAIVEYSNDAIMGGDLNGIILSWNPAAERMYRYSAEETIGQPFSILIPSRDTDEMADILGNIRAESVLGEHYETVRARKDGSTFPVYVTISPIYNSTGTLIGVSSITRDMTERNKVEKQFRDILESSPDAMVIIDKTRTIVTVNSQTEKIFGYPRDEMLGQPMELLLPSRFHANLPSELDRFLVNPRVRPMGSGPELYGRRKDGREFPAEVNVGPIETADGILVAATIRDVTDQRQMIRRLQDLNELRNEFVAIVAHDLRSPMTSISGFAHELIDQWDVIDDNKKIEYLKIITRNTDHLAVFIEDVLQVSRVEAGEFTYDIHPFDIRSLTQRVLDETAGVSGERRFEFAAPEDLPLVLGDEDRQWQVLTNLLSNAVKFSPAEEPITVGLSCSGDSVQVAVTERGIGIAKDDLPKLFVKFGRVSPPGGGKVPGNGLGLYICKTIVEAQGGRIWCESSPGRGCTFFFTIPVAP